MLNRKWEEVIGLDGFEGYRYRESKFYDVVHSRTVLGGSMALDSLLNAWWPRWNVEALL